jgi:hypothetical protein
MKKKSSMGFEGFSAKHTKTSTTLKVYIRHETLMVNVDKIDSLGNVFI